MISSRNTFFIAMLVSVGRSDLLTSPVSDLSQMGTRAAAAIAPRQIDTTPVIRRPAAPLISPRAEGLSQLTVLFINKHTAPVNTMVAQNADSPPLIAKPGVLKVGGKAQMVAPREWAGNLAIVESGRNRKFLGDETLFEASVKNWGQGYKLSLDVSYVNGFSVPMSCSCTNDKKFLTGCSKNLWHLNECPKNNGFGSCKNPMRIDNYSKVEPHKFFKPCSPSGSPHDPRAKAYTFPSDDTAMSVGQCEDGHVTCYIGAT